MEEQKINYKEIEFLELSLINYEDKVQYFKVYLFDNHVINAQSKVKDHNYSGLIYYSKYDDYEYVTVKESDDKKLLYVIKYCKNLDNCVKYLGIKNERREMYTGVCNFIFKEENLDGNVVKNAPINARKSKSLLPVDVYEKLHDRMIAEHNLMVDNDTQYDEYLDFVNQDSSVVSDLFEQIDYNPENDYNV